MSKQADQLQAIRDELAELRRELAELRQPPAQASAEPRQYHYSVPYQVVPVPNAPQWVIPAWLQTSDITTTCAGC